MPLLFRLTCLLLTLFSSAAIALPEPIARPMRHMCTTDDPFIRQAIMRELRRQYPAYDEAIIKNWPAICDGPAEAMQAGNPVDTDAPETASAPSPTTEDTASSPEAPNMTSDSAEAVLLGLTQDASEVITGFSGEVEAGVAVQSGNVEATDLNFAAKGEQEMQDWRHRFSASAFNSKQEGERINEEYRLGLGSDWKINRRDYLYAQADYVSDRFGGFNYRISESIGAGRRWIDDGTYLLDTRIGPGFRHTKFTTGDKEDSWIILSELEAGWVLNDYLELGQDALIEYSPDNTILTANSSVKSRLTEALSLKAGFMLEYVSDVPAGAKTTDTRTTAGIVYGF